mmetsp:Transcript_19190/g.49924  ORF Transcript_19190/g.49924 Transcript_19190/m.49924 type:complete len:298 (-) Transcript_19190:44-937(-)
MAVAASAAASVNAKACNGFGWYDATRARKRHKNTPNAPHNPNVKLNSNWMSHLMTTAAVDSSRLPENRNPLKSRSHIDCLLANDLPPANARQNESRASATAYSLRTPTPFLASERPASSLARKSASSRDAVSASDLWYWHRSSQENQPEALLCNERSRRTRAAARLIGSDKSAACTSASYCDATSSDTRKPVANTTRASPSIQEPVIFGWALAVFIVALVRIVTAVVAASPGSRFASWALWGFGCWAMAGLAVALVRRGGCRGVPRRVDLNCCRRRRRRGGGVAWRYESCVGGHRRA